jgi:amidase
MLSVFLLLPVGMGFSVKADGQQSNAYRWTPYDESAELESQQAHELPRMRFRLLNSRFLDKNLLWDPVEQELTDFSASRYQELKPLILEQDIPSLQRAVKSGRLSYEELVKFCLYRIRLLESDNGLSLNALISINPEAVAAARGKDRALAAGLEVEDYSLFGIPVLLKDNIGTDGMKTTAGAQVLADNDAADAFVTRRLKANGAVILGKANLSEWAYYFCGDCPLGYSAMGGQTLNPYGRKIFETGGSSSGSAVGVAANFAPVAVGSETSGSILSPASHNAAVGLKPTTGMLSRTGVVPISSTLDTLGPIAKNVTDAVILFNAMSGYDQQDLAMPLRSVDARLTLRERSLAGARLGLIAGLDSEPAVAAAVELIREAGAQVLETALPDVQPPDFGVFLGAEMKRDLATYLTSSAEDSNGLLSVEEIIMYNSADLDARAPYGQGRFEAMAAMDFSAEQVRSMREAIRAAGQQALGQVISAQRLDVLLSVNNFHASLAAAANFPALTIPLGLRADGEPVGLTLIAPSFDEQTLIDIGLALERLLSGRVAPADYQ